MQVGRGKGDRLVYDEEESELGPEPEELGPVPWPPPLVPSEEFSSGMLGFF